MGLGRIPVRAAPPQRRVELVEADFFIHSEPALFNFAKPYYI